MAVMSKIWGHFSVNAAKDYLCHLVQSDSVFACAYQH